MEWYLILLIANSILGLVMFEWSWKKMAPFRNVVEDRDSRYPPFRRLDVLKWRKWKFYPGAITLLPFRFAISIIAILVIYLIVK